MKRFLAFLWSFPAAFKSSDVQPGTVKSFKGWTFAFLLMGAVLMLTAATCDGQPLDSTRDVIMDFSNIERSTDVCLNHYHGSPQVIGTTYICKHVQDYPIYGITPGYP